jgi:hypothetical protein
MLDALSQNLVHDRNTIVLAIVGGAARYVEDPANHGFWPSSSSREPGNIGSTEVKGRIASFRISFSMTNSPILACNRFTSARYSASRPFLLTLSASTPAR